MSKEIVIYFSVFSISRDSGVPEQAGAIHTETIAFLTEGYKTTIEKYTLQSGRQICFKHSYAKRLNRIKPNS